MSRHSGALRYLGVGNTVARRLGQSEIRLVSREGVLGENVRKITVQELKLLPSSTLVLYTDGVSSHFKFDEYPGFLRDHPQIASKRVVQSFGKDFDDASCVVVRCEA